MTEITQKPIDDSEKPLPLLIASKWGFPLDHFEDEGDLLFSVIDWIAGITMMYPKNETVK